MMPLLAIRAGDELCSSLGPAGPGIQLETITNIRACQHSHHL